ncbi:MAG: hypothetical protein MJ155_02685 [Candidatus Saccharibacteria bacterium]|nr:hypothetical protein [Candidatus Saccharibacteria bacterium]
MSSKKRRRKRNKSSAVVEIVTKRPEPILPDLTLPPVTVRKPEKRLNKVVSMSIVQRIACVECWLAGNNLDYYSMLASGNDHYKGRPICSSEAFHRIWKEYGLSVRTRNGENAKLNLSFYGNEEYILEVLKERFPERAADATGFYALFYEMLHSIPN